MKKRSRRTSRAKHGTGNEDLLLDLIPKERGDLLLALDCVQDPHNLGACLRTADAAGVGAVLAPRDRAVSVTETVRHVARGAAEKVPFIQVTNLVRTLNKLKDHGFFITGTSDRAAQSIYEASFTGPTVLVMGSEGSGMRRLTAETCDQILKLPMRGYVDCLNISVAAGVCLFEIQRQRSLQAERAGTRRS